MMRRARMQTMRTVFAAFALVLFVFAAAGAPRAQQDSSPGPPPDRALAALLDAARTAASDPAACITPGADRLVDIYCKGRIRIGVRKYYPLFATQEGDERQGFEIAVARAIGRELGVAVEFVRVNAATRIPLLVEDRVDLVIATMGHNSRRNTQVRFIRPHYYRSETIIVGPKSTQMSGLDDLAGRTVCVTVGNGSNGEMVASGARFLLFEGGGHLITGLADGTCKLAAQDDSFFADAFTRADFADRFDAKFGFARVPWGMAVAPDGTADLARALDLVSQLFHRNGIFLELAQANRVGTKFLENEMARWRSPRCDTDTGSGDPNCILPPLDLSVAPTPFAGTVKRFTAWFEGATGIALSLPMFENAPAWTLFRHGVVNTLVLVVGTLVTTLAFALLFGAILASHLRLLRWPVRTLSLMAQTSPNVLTLVIVVTIAHAIAPHSASLALIAAMISLGLTNGSNAGEAIREAIATLRAEHGEALGGTALYLRALSRSSVQIMAFLINAVKGTPIASFIGAPELLSSLTDITAFSGARAPTYTLLLMFYIAVVLVVIRLCATVQHHLEKHHPEHGAVGP